MIQESENVTCLKITSDQLPIYGNLDYIFPLRELRNVEDPAPVLIAVFIRNTCRQELN